MANYALQFDGVDDYVNFVDWVESGNYTITASIEIPASGGSQFAISGAAASAGYVQVHVNGDISIKAAAGGTINVIPCGLPAGRADITISRVGTLVSYDLGGFTGSFTEAGTWNIDRFGRLQAISNYTGKFYGQCILDGATAGLRTYDFDASDHGAGTVTVLDTSSGQHGTGINMPTDGSAWVLLATISDATTLLKSILRNVLKSVLN